jgi:hypothetical protein
VYTRAARVPFLAASIGAIALLAAGCSAAGSTASHGATSSGATSGGASPAVAASASPQQALLLASKAEQKDTSLDATISVTGTSSGGALALDGTMQEKIHPSLLAELDVTTLTSAGQSVPGGLSEIITGQALYLRFPQLMQAMHVSKTWAEFRLSAMGASGSSLQSLFSQLESSSPATQSAELATSTDVHKVGTGVIDGVPVTEYAGSYSMSKAIAALPASLRGTVSKAMTAAGITSTKFTIWIDSSNQPRKMVVTEAGTTVSETTTITINSYNQPVSINLPTAAETYVVPASALGG